MEIAMFTFLLLIVVSVVTIPIIIINTFKFEPRVWPSSVSSFKK